MRDTAPVVMCGILRCMKKLPTATFVIEYEREDDGRWIAEVPRLPGVLAYGATRAEARKKVYAVALRTLADRVEEGKMVERVSRWFSYDVAKC